MMMLGRLGGVWGLKGDIKAFSESGDFDHLKSLSPLYIGLNESSLKPYEVEKAIFKSGLFLLRFKGLSTPEAVKPLVGLYLWSEREKATPLKKDEFYISDLVGYSIEDSKSGSFMGNVVSVLYGAREPLLEVKGESLTFLIPLVKPFLEDIAEKDRKVFINREFLF